MSPLFKRIVFTCFLTANIIIANAQTQQDFEAKLSDVYANTTDKKKALTIAKEAYNMVEKKKDLQTYANYYLLKNIFENHAPDAALAKTCGEKATKAMNLTVGVTTNTATPDTTNNPFNQWYYVIYPGLFTNKDPKNAEKALEFINKYPEYKKGDSYYYIAYSFERKGDFLKAKEHYEKAMAMESTEKEAYHTYLFYINFLSRSGDYLKADEYMQKVEQLSKTGNEMFRDSYKAELMGARVVYYLNIGDYQSYVEASLKNFEYGAALWNKNNPNPCNPYPAYPLMASGFGKEMMRDYDAAEKLYKSRDSANYIWTNCYNTTYPNSKYPPISVYPVLMAKRGKQSRK